MVYLALSNGRAILMMQNESDGATAAAVIAVFASVWRLRVSCKHVAASTTPDKLYDLVLKCLECPWLIRCTQTLGRMDRRGRRVREPTPSPNAVIYKSDGASRGQGRSEESHAGCGAAVWAVTI